jgi:hypothetical protein
MLNNAVVQQPRRSSDVQIRNVRLRSNANKQQGRRGGLQDNRGSKGSKKRQRQQPKKNAVGSNRTADAAGVLQVLHGVAKRQSVK